MTASVEAGVFQESPQHPHQAYVTIMIDGEQYSQIEHVADTDAAVAALRLFVDQVMGSDGPALIAEKREIYDAVCDARTANAAYPQNANVGRYYESRVKWR